MSDDQHRLQLHLQADGLNLGDARVLDFSLDEKISAPFAATVEVDLPGAIDPAAWMMRIVEVTAIDEGKGDVVRRLSGIVTGARELLAPALPEGHPRFGRTRARLTVESPIARLRYRRDFRVFCDLSSVDIAQVLFQDAGITDRVSVRVQGSPPPRASRTQAHETSLDFLARLLEEDGIFYFTEFAEDGPIVVLGDAGGALVEGRAVPFRPGSGLSGGGAITELRESVRLRPSKVTLRDHDFTKPSLDLLGEVQKESPLAREHYDYPGRFDDPAEGAQRAQEVLDAFVAGSEGIVGESTCPSITAGHTFTIEDVAEGFAGPWLVVSADHGWKNDGESTRVSCRFRAVAADASYRPARTRPKPRMPGPTLAKVRGPSGEEIHCDEHGRVKISFVWDRHAKQDDTSSAWVRVGQMHTSGSVAIPRVGWEVVVDFEDGDPDRPVVMGRVYNAVFMPPYGLPASKTQSALRSLSSPGGGGNNEIRMDDGAGSQHVRIFSQKDTNLVVGGDRTETVGQHSARTVGSNQTVSIGGNETLDVGANVDARVGASSTWSVGGSRSHTITGPEKTTVKADRDLSIGGSHTTVTAASSTMNAAGSLSESIGGSVIEATAAGVTTQVAGTASYTIGAAVIQAAAGGVSEAVLGAAAITIGGALIRASADDVSVGVQGAKATTVGGAFLANAGADVQYAATSAINILVGGAFLVNAGKITFSVGGSVVTCSAGTVNIKSSSITLEASAVHAQLAPLVEDK